jgi:hypothetical protein
MEKRTEVVTTTLRIRAPLHRKLELAAQKKGVSLNSEMANRLEQSFKETPSELMDTMGRRIEAMERRIEAAMKGKIGRIE